jgi:hypothetical protein
MKNNHWKNNKQIMDIGWRKEIIYSNGDNYFRYIKSNNINGVDSSFGP